MCYENSLRSGVKGNCMQTPQGRVEEVRGGDVRGAATPTVAQGVSGELSWVSKPITGHV